jgi:hypothetical protein
MNKMSLFLLRITTIVVVVVTGGCDSGTYYDKNSNTSSITPFQNPLDGKLTEQQIAGYIVIRQQIIADVKTQKLAKKMTIADNKPDQSRDLNFRHFDEIEKIAANSFNMSYDEFLWIKDSVITAQTQLLVQRYYDLNNSIMTLLDQTLTHYKEHNNDKLPQHEQQIMNGYVGEMKQEMTDLRGKITDSEDRSAALEHNITLVNKFKNELEALQQQALQSFTP